ncbi:MAG: ECF-type sigma factor, partial [Gemmatimonadaceae bacterium]
MAPVTGKAYIRSVETAPTQLSTIVGAVNLGDPEQAARVMPLVYDELRAIARRRLRGERADHTLRPTALVHEVYVRLADA